MALSLTPSLARKLIADPVMAAEVIMGIKLDVFQQARLVHWWFCPTVMDHSGVSTAKSEIVFIWSFLRLILLPLNMLDKHRIIAVYYISLGTAEQVFLPKIEQYLRRSRIFEQELKRQRGNKFYTAHKNVFRIEVMNGGSLELPAGDFMKDSENQASKRFNDLVLDEAALIETKGKGIDTQLMQRMTMECFNPNHPVHCNHMVLLGHAEDPSHPYHKRYLAMRRAYRRRAEQDTLTITSSFKDYRGQFREKYGIPVQRMYDKDVAAGTDPAQVAQIYDGLWKRGSRGLYSSAMREGVESQAVMPMLRREDPRTIFSLGWDSASSLKAGADLNAGEIWAADEIPPTSTPSLGTMRIGEKFWFIRHVFSVSGLGWDVDQRSGVIHMLDRAFGFSIMALDSQGGGADVYKKLREKKQFIENRWVEMPWGFCTPAEANAWPDARPIVHFYDRGDPLFRAEFGDHWVRDQTGPLDFMHRNVMRYMKAGEIAFSAPLDARAPEQVAAMSHEQRAMQFEIDKTLAQYGNIAVKLDKLGNPVMSQQGFQQFTHTGKKDGAMASNYGLLALIAKLKALSAVADDDEAEDVIEVFR